MNSSQFFNLALEIIINLYQPSKMFYQQILDSWFAIDEKEILKSLSNIFGYEQFFPRGMKLQVEGYYKKIKDMLTYEESRATTDGDFSDTDLLDLLTPADGYAYGAEFFATVNRKIKWVDRLYMVCK